MDTKTISDERLDGLDAERFRDMLASPSFALLRKRMLTEQERVREDCSMRTELPDLYRAQGATAAWRAVLALPEMLLNEMLPKKRA